MTLTPRHVTFAALALLAGLVWLAQLGLNNFYLQVLGLLGINVIMAVSLNFAAGFGGMFSLGHPAFMAIGAYTAAVLTYPVRLKASRLPGYPDWLHSFEMPFVLALGCGALAAGIAALLVGLPVLRLRGHYLAVATLGLTVIVQVSILNLVDFTRGGQGLSAIPGYSTIWWIFGAMLLTIYIVQRLVHSRFGRAMQAIRDDWIAAQTAGINIVRTRLTGFVISACFAGLAGGLLAHLLRILTPTQFSFSAVFLGITMVILGGLGSITGSVIGAIIMTLLPQYIIPLEAGGRLLGLTIPGLPGLTQVVTALILVLIMLLRPHGLVGRWELTSHAILNGLSFLRGRLAGTVSKPAK